MENLTNPVCDKNTIEFATVALEYCTFIESAQLYTLSDFVDKTLCPPARSVFHKIDGNLWKSGQRLWKSSRRGG